MPQTKSLRCQWCQRVASAIKLRWLWLSVLLGAFSVWLGLPVLSTEYGRVSTLYFGTWVQNTSFVFLETGYSFLEEGESIRLRVTVRAWLANDDPRSMRDIKYPVDVRVVLPLGTVCAASMENMPQGVTTEVFPLGAVKDWAGVYPKLSAIQLRGTDEKAKMICRVPARPRRTTFAKRAIKLEVENGTDGFWPEFKMANSNQFILEDPAVEGLKIEGAGEIDVDRKQVDLSEGAGATMWEWINPRNDMLGGIRLWISGAILGLAATTVVEAVRRFLDGERG